MTTKIRITDLLNCTTRNAYGDLVVNFEEAIQAAYPNVLITTSEPGCWGHSGDLELTEKDGRWKLEVPDGRYSSNKHFHSAGHSILAIESTRKKLNLAGCPLFLLKGYAYNGDYGGTKKTYFIFGKNEDGSFFLHKVRPSCAEDGDLDSVRKWMWEVKGKEIIAGRQGDLAFITKTRMPAGEVVEEIHIGNHHIQGEKCLWTPKRNRAYVLNPSASHHEHHSLQLSGIYELRLAKVWAGGKGD